MIPIEDRDLWFRDENARKRWTGALVDELLKLDRLALVGMLAEEIIGRTAREIAEERFRPEINRTKAQTERLRGELVSELEGQRNLAWAEVHAAPKKIKTQQAKQNAAKRLERDPKQQLKAQVRPHWLALPGQRTRKTGARAAFARDMQSRFPTIEDPRTIERWAKAWEVEEYGPPRK